MINGRCVRVVGVVAAAVLLASAVACSDDGPDLPEPRPPQATPPAPEVVLTAEEQQAVDEVRAVFDEFMTRYIDIMTGDDLPADEDHVAMVVLVSGPLVLQLDEMYDNFVHHDRRINGRLTWEFLEPVSVDMDRTVERGDEEINIPEVLVRYCVDASDWTYVDGETGEPADLPEDRLVDQPGTRGPVTVRAAYFDPWPDLPEFVAAWHLTDWTEGDGPPC